MSATSVPSTSTASSCIPSTGTSCIPSAWMTLCMRFPRCPVAVASLPSGDAYKVSAATHIRGVGVRLSQDTPVAGSGHGRKGTPLFRMGVLMGYRAICHPCQVGGPVHPLTVAASTFHRSERVTRIELAPSAWKADGLVECEADNPHHSAVRAGWGYLGDTLRMGYRMGYQMQGSRQ